MARVTHVKSAQQRYKTVPVLNDDGTPKIVPVLRRDGTPKRTKTGREVTMRVTIEDKSQPLPNRTCDKCGTEIKPGMPYKWVKTKTTYGGTKRVRCATCPTWTQSELSTSKMAGVYAAQEEFSDFIGSWNPDDGIDAVRDALNNCAEQVRSVGEEYRESASNIEEGFGHPTYMSEELEQKADELESWADEIEQAVDSVDDEPEADDDCEHCEGTGQVDCETCGGTGNVEGETTHGNETDEAECDDCTGTGQTDCQECSGSGKSETPGEETTEAWADEVRSAATDVVDNCPV